MFLLPNSRYQSDSTPVVMVCILAVSTILWLLLWSMSYPQTVFTRFGFIPAHPHLMTTASALFISHGVFYFLPPMLFLLTLGKQLEDVFGHFLFLALFMVCGIAGTILFYLMHRSATAPCTGAAGAVAGVIAAFWVIFPEEVFDVEFHLGWWHVTDFEARTFAVAAAWLGWQCIAALVEDRAARGFILWSNVGGFAAGLSVAWLMKPALLRGRKQRPPDPEPAVSLTQL